MSKPLQIPPDAKHYVSLTKSSIYMVANQMPNKADYIKDVMANSEYSTDTHVLLSTDNYDKLDRKYASKNKLRDVTKTDQPAQRKGCVKCRRKKKTL